MGSCWRALCAAAAYPGLEQTGHRLVEPGQDGHFTVLGRQPTTGQLQLGAGHHADCGGGAVHWTVALSGGCGAASSDTEMISIWLTVVN